MAAQKRIAVAVIMAFAGSASAFDFETDGGWHGALNTTVSASSSWRAEAQDKNLISAKDALASKIFVPTVAITGATANAAVAEAIAAGYKGGSPSDDAELNYDKGDSFSRLYKFVTELSLKKERTGALVRVKGWYDDVLHNDDVRWGHQGNGYAAGKPYSDNGATRLNRFDGLYLLDAYAYTEFDAAGLPLQVRAGRQAINWGESVFVQGVNQLTPLDLASLRKAGTEIKEALLPVWSLYGNLGLRDGMSLEGFYQLKWEPNNIDSCGSYWAPAGANVGTSIGVCNMATSLGAVAAASNAAAYPLGTAAAVRGVDGVAPGNGGQWGLSLKFPVNALDTEFGLYAMNIHSRVPVLSGRIAKAAGTGAAMVAFWEYPEDIKVYGLSAATTLAGISVGAELSYNKDVPVQINGNDLLAAGLYAGLLPNAGPLGFRVAPLRTALAAGTTAANGAYFAGYDRFNKTQFQVNGLTALPTAWANALGASNGALVGEIAAQWNNLPDYKQGGLRYGRGFIYGFGSNSSYAGVPGFGTGSVCGTAANAQPYGCQNDGYITDSAWGYRLRASLDYPQIFGSSWQATPSIFFGHDVDGYSLDSQFIKDRQALSLGLRLSLNKEHNIDIGYTTYSNRANFDALHDRDNYSFVYNYSF